MFTVYENRSSDYFMKILSEVLNREFQSVDECIAAEEEYSKKQEVEKAKKDALVEKRRERAKEVNDAYQNYIEAANEYTKLANKFIKDYQSFHMTYNSKVPVSPMNDLLSLFFNL